MKNFYKNTCIFEKSCVSLRSKTGIKVLFTIKVAIMKHELIRVGGREVTTTNSTWRGLVAKFLSEQDVRESSRALYSRTLSQFFFWMESTGRVLIKMELSDVLEYKAYLEREKQLSSLSVGSYLTAVRKFFTWAEARKFYPNIAKGVKVPRKCQAFKKKHLSQSKCSEVLSYYGAEGDAQNLRNFAIVNLMLRTGLRTIEVVRANVGDISYEGDARVLHVWGKGRDADSKAQEFVILSEKAYTPLRNYLATRKNAKAGEPLFTSDSHQNHGGRLSTRTISYICKEALKAIGLDGREFSAHTLRHTTAVTILKAGGSIFDVQEVLRHADPKTSQIYTESIKKEHRLERAIELTLDRAF